MAEQFAELVADVRADNKQLRNGMKEAERIVSTSAKNIETRFSAMARNSSRSLQNLTSESEKFKSGLAGATRAASLLGGQSAIMVLVIADIGITMGAAAAKMSLFAKSAALVVGGMKAVAAVLLGPVGVVAGIIALGAAAAAATDPKTLQWLTDWQLGVKKLDEANRALTMRLREQRKEMAKVREEAERARIKAIVEQRKVATTRRGDLRARQGIAGLLGVEAADRAWVETLKEAEQIQKRITDERKLQASFVAQSVRQSERQSGRQLALVLGLRKPEDFAVSGRQARIIMAQRVLSQPEDGTPTGKASLGRSAALRFGGGRDIQVGGRDPVVAKLETTNELLEKIKDIIGLREIEASLGN